MLYILTRVWVLCIQNPDQNLLFKHFQAKNLKKKGKVRKLMQNRAINMFFEFAPKGWSKVMG